MKKYLEGLKIALISMYKDFIGLFTITKIVYVEVEHYERHLKVKDSGGIIISGQELRTILINKLKNKLDINICFQIIDKTYYLPSKKYVQDILEIDQLNYRKYKSDTFDCDDFSFLSNSTFIELTYKDDVRRAPFSYGIVFGLITTPHAINVFVDDKEDVYFIEPQSDVFMTIDDDKIKSIYTLIV